MAPQRKKTGKKKRPKQDRNEKISSCTGCSVALDRKDFLYCECTQVRFCSEKCQRDHPHDGCPGPPETTVDVLERLGDRGQDAMRIVLERDEFQETVQKPINDYIRTKIAQRGHPSDFTVWDYADMADEGESLGNQACAYLAAVKFKHRVFGAARRRGGRTMVNNNDVGTIPVLESQDLAFQYFEKAAKLGHGLSMQSLGECFDEGIGCRKNHRRCAQWLWRASLQHSKGAIEMMDGKTLLPKDVAANIMMLDRRAKSHAPGGSIELGGPNIGCLLLAFCDVVVKENYSLPPFAGPWATATVNNRPVDQERLGVPRIPLIGSEEVKKLMRKVHALENQGSTLQVRHGRRGAAKQATSLCLSSSTTPRPIDNQLFFVPPQSACDERVTDIELNEWRRKLLYPECPDKVIYPFCVHNEHDQHHLYLYCSECEAEARLRLEAVSFGRVALSIDEALDQRGQAAFFRHNSNGAIVKETWKNYGVGEAECVLAVLAASGNSAYVTPIFIAQDPNLFWPLIADHGCIRAALEFVAPHINWDAKIGKTKQALNPVPIIPGCQPHQCLRKCGHGLCANLNDYKEKQFLCGGCERRVYCSDKCQADDWPLHRFECKLSKEANPRIDDPKVNRETKEMSMKYSLEVKEGEDAVVHGLKAKPEYNGMVGLVGESDGNDRFALTLRSGTQKTISIKPENLHCIGVFCRKRKKKSRVFECAHGLERCPQCYFDFTTINHLCRLKYSGNDICGSFVTDEVNETHFASFKLKDSEDEYRVPKDWPIECYGMESHLRQRLILKALLGASSEMSINAVVGKTAFITFGGTKHPQLRALTKLEKVSQML